MGGIGKSEIAKMYLEKHASDYEIVLWISFEHSLRRTIADDHIFPIHGINRTDYPEDDEQTYFQRKLRILKDIAGERVLIVLDNFDVTGDPDLETFCSGRYGVLFTSRCHQDCTNIREVEIREMDEEQELLALFCTEYKRTMSGEDEKMVLQIIHYLSGHTLSIRLVASTMQSRRLKPAQMLELLQQGSIVMASKNERAADLIFGRLRKVFSLAEMGKDELFLLKNLALMPFSGIDVETFCTWCETDDYDIVDALIQKSWIIHDPVKDQIHLHPLVTELAEEKLVYDPDCCNQLIRNLADACTGMTTKPYEETMMLFHVTSSVARRLPEDHPMRYDVMDCQSKLLMEVSIYQDAEDVFMNMLPLAVDIRQSAYLFGRIAHSRSLRGDASGCLIAAKEGIQLFDQVNLDEMDKELGYCREQLLKRLIESNRMSGNYEEALHYGNLALVTCDRFYQGSPEENRAWTEYHIARTYYMKGDLSEAEKLLRHALSLFEKIHDIWGISHCFDLLGQIMADQDTANCKEALEMNMKAWEIRLPLLGGEHTDMANNLAWRARLYRISGDEDKAVGYARQAMDIFEKRNCSKRIEAVASFVESRTTDPISF